MLTLLTKIFSKVSELGPDGFVKQLIYRVNPTFFTKELSAPETAAGTDIKQSFSNPARLPMTPTDHTWRGRPRAAMYDLHCSLGAENSYRRDQNFFR